MCGRFTLTVDPADLQAAFADLAIIAPALQPRYNIASSQAIASIHHRGGYYLEHFVWGLVPSWAKDPSLGGRMINARAETITEKPAFRTPFRRRRCLIPADGFYEWQTTPGSKTKTPIYFSMKSRRPFAFAGVWDIWSTPDGSTLNSCCIITTRPNELVAPVHNRMPVILPPSAYVQWLDPSETRTELLLNLLTPYDAGEMQAFPVSRLVNATTNDSPECIRPSNP